MPAAHHSAIMINGLLHIYFSSVGSNGINFWLATSTNGIDFDVKEIPVLLTGTEDAVMGNPALLINDGVLYNWYEANQNPAGGQIWKTYLAVADPANPSIFVKQGPIPTLQKGTGTYGGHTVRKVGRLFNAWSINAPVGVTPSEIYHHYSVEGRNWGILNGGNPVLRITQAWEGDQVADPEVHGLADHSLMFYSTVNNPAATGTICVARINHPLSAICPA